MSILGPTLEAARHHVRDSVRIERIQYRARSADVERAAVVGGAVGKKKYDPLWEIVDEKVALQGQEPDIDVRCPYCNVTVHLEKAAKPGQRYACGLCGGVSEVRTAPDGEVGLEAVDRRPDSEG